jgi:hypothetical protein
LLAERTSLASEQFGQTRQVLALQVLYRTIEKLKEWELVLSRFPKGP